MDFSEQKQNNILILSLNGNICTKEVTEIRAYIIPYVKEDETKGLILDLLDVNVIDSAGIALIVQLYKVFKAENKKIVLSALTGKNRDIFSMTKLDRILPLMDNIEEAMKVFI